MMLKSLYHDLQVDSQSLFSSVNLGNGLLERSKLNCQNGNNQHKFNKLQAHFSLRRKNWNYLV
eukprot:maker-scaffold_4-snap-gene-8.62-mRNA-1 protein AED:0.25 eAED:0.38 QI:0/0/0.33/0.66/0/0/3/263/62